jgi:hypothetical protein
MSTCATGTGCCIPDMLALGHGAGERVPLCQRVWHTYIFTDAPPFPLTIVLSI